jgi:hypothetical protein
VEMCSCWALAWLFSDRMAVGDLFVKYEYTLKVVIDKKKNAHAELNIIPHVSGLRISLRYQKW